MEKFIGKTCVIGLSYFDVDGGLIKQNLLAGKVRDVSKDDGIQIALMNTEGTSTGQIASSTEGAIFMLPAEMRCWFTAPPGRYHAGAVTLDNPDYLVTWDIYQTKRQVPEGTQQWWEWQPRLAPPQVGALA